jgi:GxxExxY protein
MHDSFKVEYPESALTGKIIGCAMEVHRTLGTGFQEVIYQRAMAIELNNAGLKFSREHKMIINYKEKKSEHDLLIFLLNRKSCLN